MQCPNCQFENREDVSFCEKCGKSLESECPNCGIVLPFDRNFCGKCGYEVIAEEVIKAQERLSKGIQAEVMAT